MLVDIDCNECGAEVEVDCYTSSAGNPDINSATCCPPSPYGQETTHCPECGAELDVVNADEIEADEREAADEQRFDDWKERNL